MDDSGSLTRTLTVSKSIKSHVYFPLVLALFFSCVRIRYFANYGWDTKFTWFSIFFVLRLWIKRKKRIETKNQHAIFAHQKSLSASSGRTFEKRLRLHSKHSQMDFISFSFCLKYSFCIWIAHYDSQRMPIALCCCSSTNSNLATRFYCKCTEYTFKIVMSKCKRSNLRGFLRCDFKSEPFFLNRLLNARMSIFSGL